MMPNSDPWDGFFDPTLTLLIFPEHKEALRDQRPMVTILVKCILHRDKKLGDLFAHLG